MASSASADAFTSVEQPGKNANRAGPGARKRDTSVERSAPNGLPCARNVSTVLCAPRGAAPEPSASSREEKSDQPTSFWCLQNERHRMQPVHAYSARAASSDSGWPRAVAKNAWVCFPHVLVVSECVDSDTGHANRQIFGQ